MFFKSSNYIFIPQLPQSNGAHFRFLKKVWKWHKQVFHIGAATGERGLCVCSSASSHVRSPEEDITHLLVICDIFNQYYTDLRRKNIYMSSAMRPSYFCIYENWHSESFRWEQLGIISEKQFGNILRDLQFFFFYLNFCNAV